MHESCVERVDGRPGGEPGIAAAPRVVVVGAGVSGCACAATLAAGGLGVTVLNSALDSVGQPGYGPVVLSGGGGWGRIVDVMGVMPEALRDAWLNASVASEGGAPFFCVDRRMLSIETKRALESIPGLRFRQGLVTGLRIGRKEPSDEQSSEGSVSGDVGRQARVVAETAFGEEIEADAVVLAVGLGLGVRLRVGDDVLSGGRWGEISASGLRIALERVGAAFREATVNVGPCFSRFGREGTGVVPLRGALQGARPGDTRFEDDGTRSGGCRPAWPEDYPPAPHWTDELGPSAVVVGGSEEGQVIPAESPDGVATGEVYQWPEALRSADGSPGAYGGVEVGRRAIASRLEHSVTGLVITNCGPTGRLMMGKKLSAAIWVAGRAGGAADYLDSLACGVRVARDVATVVGRTVVDDGANVRRETR